MNILKFGGTSVGSVASISTLLEVVAREVARGERPVVVLSAMSGVTNLLLAAAEEAAAGRPVTTFLMELENRHFGVVKSLLDAARQNPVLTRLKLLFNELEDLLHGISSLRELTPQTLDRVLSYGERCATFLVSALAAGRFPEALCVEATELIRTDAHYGQARVDTELTEQLIRGFVGEHPGRLLFVTGFIARNAQGRVTTLGRGGSDYTAAILGAALGAREIQIWTDVNGMMTADPRMVKKAFSLPELSYTEAMELSYFGAKVIYPPTMIPAFMRRIPIVIRNTFDLEFAGTTIRHDCQPSALPIKGISSINDISVINVEGSGMVGKAGFSGRLFSLLAREQINVILITQASSEHSITFAVAPHDAVRARELIGQEFELELQARKLELPGIEQDLAVLAIVGENMKQTPGIAGKLFQALGRNGVNVRAIAQGSSEYNISVIIGRADLAKALNAVHDAFFVELTKTLHVFALGTGNIGRTLLGQLHAHQDFLREQNGVQVRVVGLSNSRRMVIDPGGLPLDGWEAALDNGHSEPADLARFVARMKQLNLPNCVLIDNTAAPEPAAHYADALRHSISVVTCNKIANSGPYQQYRELRDAARQHGADFYYETNVGAGLPIIRTLRDLRTSGDRVERIEAILSGTISFIFNNFRGAASFHDIVREAQQRGYTEPDPRDDLNGRDFMRKMLILARDAGHPLEPDDVVIEPMLPAACLQAPTVAAFYEQLRAHEAYFAELKDRAAAAGQVLRYIGQLEDGRARISLQMVDEQHPFYQLSGADNVISFTTGRYKERPLVVKGPGAGAEVTAAGVFADLVNVGTR
ncbi:bifunctional aspartate kinase/homoserine dehydrogenase I [Hymenobacter jeollabukensis]|uniref:Bifunctional aspartate kinase/homoserine dehydrogenase I n=1 Tax=Hymenobacter jeollabukensis TaxID=2025313 RepID=A0A5R8WUL2_9BACT|nr:bifunctional aspartate kinase/homoserine dehydrogenase I [Hymenobacter jeollabukensis]TLM95183.1 bifunctional aspartate kinase/homoserine dehydrogenase I [Hymenobacter jeollabukensis]